MENLQKEYLKIFLKEIWKQILNTEFMLCWMNHWINLWWNPCKSFRIKSRNFWIILWRNIWKMYEWFVRGIFEEISRSSLILKKKISWRRTEGIYTTFLIEFLEKFTKEPLGEFLKGFLEFPMDFLIESPEIFLKKPWKFF